MNIKVRIKKGFEDCIPEYMTNGSSGMDVKAAVDSPIYLDVFNIGIIPCGFYLQIPKGYEAQVRPRSGLSYKHGITMPNSPGTIDSDYRGEVCVILCNMGDIMFPINRGDRIAQIVFNKIELPTMYIVNKLSDTKRGEGGFGSTGK